MTERKLNSRMRRIAELDAQVKELNRQLDELKAEVKEDMGDAEEIVTKQFIVKNTPYESSHFDTKSFKETHKKLYEKFTTVKQTTRFSWKEVV